MKKRVILSLIASFLVLSVASGQGKFSYLKLMQKTGKWGLSTRGQAGKMVLDYEYDRIDQYGGTNWLLVKSGKMGMADSAGKIFITIQYDMIGKIRSGVALIKQNGKYGYMDITGKEIFTPQFDKADEFYDKKTNKDIKKIVVMKDGKFGIIESNGNTVLPCELEEMGSVSDGLILSKKDGKYGFLDGNAQWIISPQFFKADNFSNGKANIYSESGKKGMIDKSGKIIIQPNYDAIGEISEGVATVQLGGLWGLSDTMGNQIVECKYLELRPARNGHIAVHFQANTYTEKNTSEDPILKKINKKELLKDGWGFLNLKGEIFMPPFFSSVNDFKNGIAIVTLRDGTLGYINRFGKFSK